MKKLNKLVAILVSLAMMATLCVITAFADDTPTGTPANSKLVKYLVVPEGTNVPTVVNEFSFANYEAGSSGVTAAELTASKPADETITINAQSANSLAEDDFNSKVASKPMPALHDFDHPGVYAYVVTEDSSTITDATADQAIVKDNSAYIIRYYVKNVNGVPTVTQITAQEATVNPDTGEVTGVGDKVDPTDDDPTGDVDDNGTPEDTSDDGVKAEDVPGVAFTNTYRKTETPDDPNNPAATAPLKVTKAIAGTDADANKSFPFKIKLTQALGADPAALTGQVYNADGTTDGAAITVAYGADNVTFNLKGGQYFAIQNIPSGTRYEVYEQMANADTYSAWKPAVAVNNGTEVFTDSAELGESLAAQADNATYLLSENDSDVIAYTNTYDKNLDTPTGILMNNLPFIVLALVAIGGLVAYVVVRRRDADEA